MIVPLLVSNNDTFLPSLPYVPFSISSIWEQKSNSLATKNRGNFTNWRLQAGTNFSRPSQVRIINNVSNILARLQSNFIFFLHFYVCIVLLLHYALNSWDASKFRPTAVSNAFCFYYTLVFQVNWVDIIVCNSGLCERQHLKHHGYILRAASSTFAVLGGQSVWCSHS